LVESIRIYLRPSQSHVSDGIQCKIGIANIIETLCSSYRNHDVAGQFVFHHDGFKSMKFNFSGR